MHPEITFAEAQTIAEERGWETFPAFVTELERRYNRLPRHLQTTADQQRAYAARIEWKIRHET